MTDNVNENAEPKNENTPPENTDNSPNANYKDDPKLDENGNPVEGKPKEEAKPPKEDNKDEGDKADLANTPSDKILNYKDAKHVEGLLEQAKLVPEDVAEMVAKNGGEVPTELAKSLRETHGEAVAELIEDKLKGFYKSTIDVVRAKEKVIFDQVENEFKGVTDQKGEQTWDELATWAKANIDATTRKELNGMLDKGGIAAKKAVEHIVQEFKNSDSFSQEAKLVGGDNLSQDYGVKTIDKSGYDRELRKLLESGHDYDTSPEIAQLNKRRLKAISRGQ